MRRLSTLWSGSRVVQGLVLGALGGCLIFALAFLGWTQGLERGALDAMFFVRGRVWPSPHVVIVQADESTLARYHRWPFRRKLYADLVRALKRAGAKTIAFDIQFSTPSDSPADDRALINASREAGNVVHASVFHLFGTAVSARLDSAGQSLNRSAERFRLDDHVTNHERFGLDAVFGSTAVTSLLSSAAGMGHVTVYPEWDGSLRRIPHYIRYRDHAYPSLALAAAARYLGVPQNRVVITDNAAYLGNRRIPLDRHGETLVNWCGPTGTFPTYTFQEILATEKAEMLPAEALRGSVVLIGITHPGAYERYATPFSPSQPALELQANALDNILVNRPIQDAPAWVPTVLIFFMALLGGVLASWHGVRLGALWMVVFGFLMWAAGAFLLARVLFYLPVATPILAGLLATGLALAYRQRRDALDLRVAKERYALAARGTNDGIWDWNLQTGEIYYSPRWKALLGVTHPLAPTLDAWMNRVHPDDLAKIETDFQRHLSGQSVHFENEHRIRHEDGEYRWVLARGLRVLEDEKPSRMAGSLTDITTRKQAEAELLHNAFYDGLTGLPNRALFLDRLGRALARAHRHSDYLFAVLFIDLDRFKIVNDSLGHGMGDQLLTAVSHRLGSCLRPGDTAARLGGDEFTLLLDDITDIEDARLVAARIKQELSRPFDLEGHEVVSTASIGIVVGRDKDQPMRYHQPAELLRDADTALYRAKALGRARYEVFDEAMHMRAVSLLKLEADLRRAIEQQEFRAYYQPVISLATGRISGFEALVRWHHPTRGMVPPGEFVPLAEETGLIVLLDQWVLREACRQTRIWQEQFGRYAGLTISVNLSSRNFSQPDLADQVSKAVREQTLGFQSLRLEITESVILDNIESTATMLEQLKALGLQLAIDDFGTGYSALSYLHRLPLNILKVDRSFVSRLGHNGENNEIVRAIISLARNLNMSVVAEGVENAPQAAILSSLQADFMQGYFFSQPLSSEEATTFLSEDCTWIIPDIHAVSQN